MARPEVVQAVRQRLGDTWNGIPVYGLNFEGTTPGDGSEFIELQFPVARSRQWGLGRKLFREEGAFRIILQAQRGVGLEAANARAEELAALFRAKKFGGVQTFAPDGPVLDDRDDAGLYYPLSVSVPYWFYFADDSGFD